MVELRQARAALIGLLAMGLVGCTAQDRYYSVRNQNLEECERKLSDVERERCREQLAPASYEEYERMRSTVPVRADPVRRTRKDAGG